MTMILALAGALLSTAPAGALALCVERPAPAPVAGPVVDEYRQLYEAGAPYESFLRDATGRRALWDGNTEKAEAIDASVVARARAVGGTWRLLVVAVDSCSDSVSTIPYLARLAALVDGLDLRIVDSTAGRAIMESHRTPDGRAATPTVLLLDEDYEERGCFIERPRSLQDWLEENDGQLSARRMFEGKMEWYANDSGHQTVDEVVTILEAAAAGRTICGR